MSATADFSQNDIQGIQAYNIHGYRLFSGRFIFAWDDGQYRKMVMTKNDGEKINSGYMLIANMTSWKTSTAWTDYEYSIANFKAREHIPKGMALFHLISV